MPIKDSDDHLILVDDHDKPLGSLDKEACHDGEGLRHRAFSVWVRDSNNRFLVQQRAASKRLWPGFWSNACCSHPRLGETTEAAAHRRLQQELKMQVSSLQWLYSFNYQAAFGEQGSENEHCHVFLAASDHQPWANPEEISALRWLHASALDQEIAANPQHWTPWLKLEWAELKARFL